MYLECRVLFDPIMIIVSELTKPLSADRYIQLLKENREKGYRGRQQNYVPGVDGPSGGPEILTDYPTAQQAKGGKGSDLRPGNTSGNGGDVLY